MLSYFTSVQYCYTYLIDQIPVGLLLYSHIPTALIALLFGGYILKKERSLPSITLFTICVAFSAWCLFDLISWFAFLGADKVMFAWSFLDLLALIMFFFSYYFLHTFVTKTDLPSWQKITGSVLLLPTIYWTFLGKNLPWYDGNSCAAIENDHITRYPYFVEVIFILAAFSFIAYQYKKITEKSEKKKLLLVGAGVTTFLLFFFSSTFLVNLLAEGDASLYVYNFEIYGLFGMPILLVYLGFLIVKYKAFDLRVFSVQALGVATITIVATQYAFLNTWATVVLNSVNLALVGIVSAYLIRNVRREIALRKELELANIRQQETMRFITHEVKGYLTDGAAALDALISNTFGPITPDMKEMLTEALAKNRNGVREIQNFLRIADFKTGKVSYGMKQFDFKKMLDETLVAPTDNAKNKGLGFAVEITPADYTMVGDGDQILNHVIVNLINNAINYTPKGDVSIHLERNGNTIRFSVKDSGVGLTEDDKKVLFTEGGHGKESRAVNPHSTGYGLFIAKQIVDAHHGRIWAESTGRGAGSTFFVELPTDLRPTLASVAPARTTA